MEPVCPGPRGAALPRLSMLLPQHVTLACRGWLLPSALSLAGDNHKEMLHH